MVAQVYVFDFTLKAENITRAMVERYLRKSCKKWCFQLERGKEGYLHYQGRCSLRNKTYEGVQLKVQPWVNHCHWSATSNAHKDDVNYICKESFMNVDLLGDSPDQIDPEDEGVWTEKNVEEVVYIPRQIREIVNLRPWQQSVIDKSKIWNTRNINMIIDTLGNIGKSVLVGYMRCHKIARKLPPLNDYKDVMRMVCDIPTSKCYLFDMPRAMKKDKLGSLYTAIEEIKTGYAWDDRYSFKEKFFDSPQIWVFTNNLPDFTLLTDDRWVLWEVDPETKTLEKFNLDEE